MDERGEFLEEGGGGVNFLGDEGGGFVKCSEFIVWVYGCNVSVSTRGLIVVVVDVVVTGAVTGALVVVEVAIAGGSTTDLGCRGWDRLAKTEEFCGSI